MTLTPQAALARAVQDTGLDDFGDDHFREGLERMLAAAARMPLLPEVREAFETKTIADLSLRLKIERWYADHPEIEEQPVESVVLVCGLPRTGTTATVGMLALDDRFRFLRAWEGAAPVPPPILAEEASDPRRIAAHEASASYGMAEKHIHDPDGPEEDIAMISGLTMHSYNGHLPMPDDYIAWWVQKDFTAHYGYLERVLKLLHSRRPPHVWLLKSPPHLFHLDAFARRFPDTRYVWTHRDPAKLISSVASLQSGMQAERCEPGTIDPAERGRGLLAFWREGVSRGLAARDAIGEEPFIDVLNDDVVKRPIETFERIYRHLGLELDEPLRAKLAAYNESNAPGAFGAHKHEPEGYGMTRDEIRTTFADYIDRFDL